jgi:hypothetical protein
MIPKTLLGDSQSKKLWILLKEAVTPLKEAVGNQAVF